MSIATHGPKGLWVNPVYFAWDDNFSLYFISQKSCAHMDNLQSNVEVSCAIYPTNRPAGQDVYGAYIQGRAEILEDEHTVRHADKVYYARVYPNESQNQEKKDDAYRNDPSWHFVKVIPTGMWYFDTRYFGETRVPVPGEIWR